MTPQLVSRSDAEMAGMRSEISSAIADGSLVRPENCSACGKFCTPDGHHEDYGKPLEVIWLCRICHSARHAELSGRPPKQERPERERKRKPVEEKQRLQPDVSKQTAFAIKMEAARNNCTVGAIIERLAESITAKWQTAGAK